MVGKGARLLAEIWKVRAGWGDPELTSLLIGYTGSVHYGVGPRGPVTNTDWV